jgi:hypothetical protein
MAESKLTVTIFYSKYEMKNCQRFINVRIQMLIVILFISYIIVPQLKRM